MRVLQDSGLTTQQNPLDAVSCEHNPMSNACECHFSSSALGPLCAMTAPMCQTPPTVPVALGCATDVTVTANYTGVAACPCFDFAASVASGAPVETFAHVCMQSRAAAQRAKKDRDDAAAKEFARVKRRMTAFLLISLAVFILIVATCAMWGRFRPAAATAGGSSGYGGVDNTGREMSVVGGVREINDDGKSGGGGYSSLG
jgi:hypothetical protein